MRIACPTCDVTYEVPDALIGTGRRLRCAKCDHEWLARAEAPPPADPAPPPTPPGLSVEPADAPRGQVAVPPPAAARPARSGGRAAMVALWVAWIGSGLLLGALGAGAWVYRGPIMQAWPPAARVYLLLGTAQQG